MSFRDIKVSARAALHDIMKVRALYVSGTDDPVPVTVRVHTQFKALGEVKGTSFDYAEREEDVPMIVFLYAQVPSPTRNAKVIISAEEGYLVDHTMPRDTITVKAKVKPMTTDQLVGAPYPGDADWPESAWDGM